MLIGGGEFMRRRIKVRTVSESNDATNSWIQHLVNRIIVEELKLPRRLQAKLRHTNATILMKHGTNPKIVSERLGHANVSITLDIYSHTDLDMQNETANRDSS
jgi:integrase